MRYLVVVLLLIAATWSTAATFTVTNLSNAGAGSFRQALIDANSAAGSDDITFSVSGTILILSPLPPITDQVDIDGTSAPGYIACGAPSIQIDGTSSGSANGIQFFSGATGSSVQALNVRNFLLNGIQFVSALNCQVRACYVGTNAAGTAAASNGLNGIQVESAANNIIIGGAAACDGNLISGNGGFGVSINGSVSPVISGNIIGLNAAGTSSIANAAGGVLGIAGSNGIVVGGSLVSERNIISGNGNGLTGNGINLDGLTGPSIRGNYLGLDVTGTVGIGNAENGISLNAVSNAVIGGSGVNDMNVIANHNFHAIVLNNGSNNASIQGNNIGTNALGTVAIGNDDSGIIIINSSGTIIGGTGANEGNILSGSLSEYGIFAIASNGLTIQGNFIGTDRTGTINLANLSGGIRFDFSAGASTIGGSAAGAGNIIAFNTGYGIGVLNAASNQVLISRNSIYCNTNDGIELNGVGNTNHPSPVIVSADNTGASGTASPNDIIELFYDFNCGASCQGRTYIATVIANGSGAWSYVGALTGNITATATDASNNTSEFANCLIFLPVEFGEFSGTITSIGNLLNWNTLSEKDASHFVLEHLSSNEIWVDLGHVQAVGNSSSNNDYHFIHREANPGINYYRLLQYDVDGSQDIHETIVRLNNKSDENRTLIGIFNLLGQEIDADTKGVQIHRFDDGTSQKLVRE